jgi:choline dehydrogenase-like flavoprotein
MFAVNGSFAYDGTPVVLGTPVQGLGSGINRPQKAELAREPAGSELAREPAGRACAGRGRPATFARLDLAHGERALLRLDPEGRVYGVEGLVVVDAPVFPTASGVNPMLTIVALAHRATSTLIARGAASASSGSPASSRS